MIDYFDPATNRSYRNRFLLFRRKFIICPEQWETISSKYNDFHWEELQFTRENLDEIEEVEGIYLFCSSPKKVNAPFINYFFYVGQTNNLQNRFSQYLDKVHSPKSGQYKMYTIIQDYPEHLFFYYTELPGSSEIERRTIENDFLTAFVPPINSIYPQGLQSIIQAAYAQ